MSRLKWDQTGERTYETGVSDVALFPIQSDGTYSVGVAWNGVSAINDSPSGAEPTPIYADNIKYLNLMSAEESGGTIEGYSYPDEFSECDGSKEVAPGVYAGQQSRKIFGLAYKTIVGNDTESNDYGYKIHLVWGALASPSEKAYQTISDSPEPASLSWEYTTTPVTVTETSSDGTKIKPLSTLTINSVGTDSEKMTAFENIIYGKDPTTAGGSDGSDPRLPMPDEIIAMMKVTNGSTESNESTPGGEG